MRNSFIITAFFSLFMVVNALYAETMWLDEVKKKKCCEATSASTAKELALKSGSLKENTKIKALDAAVLYIRDTEGNIEEQNLSGAKKILFSAPYKGNYHFFAERRYVKDGVLNVELSSLRIYNKEGNITQSWPKEVRGKTSDSRYLSQPLPELRFQLIAEKSIHRHHINCCLYSGDIAPFKVYYKGELLHDVPLNVEMESGWQNVIEPSDDGTMAFEIPRSSYAPDKGEKKRSEKLLVSAQYDTNESGVFEGEAYRGVHYTMGIILSFGNSPLEYESKTLAFATVIGVMLVLSLGLYYNRRRKRKTPKEIWFDEE